MVTQTQKKAERDYSILTTLGLLDMATRSQLQKIHRLGSNRNASRILKNLGNYINHFRVNENIYYLNKAGRELIGCKKVIAKTLQFEHTLMKGDIYIHFGKPKMWATEFPIKLGDGHFIPDAIFEVQGQQYFLEVDRMQKMSQNLEKLKTYQKFKETGLWQQMNGGKFPILIFYTLTDTRKHQLQEMNSELTLQLLTKKDLFS